MTDFLASRLLRSVRAVVPSVDDVSIGDGTVRATWTVQPASKQVAAQPTIDSFDPDDPAHATADLQAVITATLDNERLIAAVVWAVIDTYSAPATRAKYLAARTKIITAYRDQPWKA